MWGKLHRGFESLPLRHWAQPNTLSGVAGARDENGVRRSEAEMEQSKTEGEAPSGASQSLPLRHWAQPNKLSGLAEIRDENLFDERSERDWSWGSRRLIACDEA